MLTTIVLEGGWTTKVSERAEEEETIKKGAISNKIKKGEGKKQKEYKAVLNWKELPASRILLTKSKEMKREKWLGGEIGNEN